MSNATPAGSMAAQQATPPPKLLTIPNELFERIAEAADKEDLLNLRLVAREASARVMRTYTKVYFTERAFLLSSGESLRTLLEIASHATYGRSMRRVVLCIDAFESKPNGNKVFRARHITPEEFDSLQQEWEFKTQLAIQASFTDTRSDLGLLNMIFANFKMRDNVVEVQVKEQFTEKRCAKGVQTLESLTGRFLKGPDPRAMKRAFMLVLDALTLSALPVERMTFRCEDYGVEIDDLGLYTNTHFYTTITTVFQNLRQLDLHFVVESNATEEALNSFIDILTSAPHLEDLALRSRYDTIFDSYTRGYRNFAKIAMNATFPRLKHLDLEGLVVRYGDVVGFVSRHRMLERIDFVMSLLYAVPGAKMERAAADNVPEMVESETSLPVVTVDEGCQIMGRCDDTTEDED